MITKVRLRNWKSHEESELEFSEGTNGLVGIVGSGKTSVLDAICFAFFGTFPKLQAKKLKIEDVIMKKPVSKSSAEVEVFFSLDSGDYSVKRMIDKGRGTSYSELKEDGNMIESPGTKDVTAAVEKILKVNYELFSKAIYSEQNALDYFLTLGKGQRMNKIDELLMIDRFEEARANAVTLTNKIIERRIGKQSAVEQLNVAEAERMINEIMKSMGEMEKEKVTLRATLESVSRNKAAAEAEAVELRRMRENLEKLRRGESGFESAISTTIETLADIEKNLKEFYEKIGQRIVVEEGMAVEPAEIGKTVEEMGESYSRKIEEMNGFLNAKQAEYDEIQGEMAKSKANIEFLKGEKIGRLERELEEKMKIKAEFEHLRDRTGENIVEQIKENQDALHRLAGELEAARVRMSDIQEQMGKLSAIVGVCPLCGAGLSEERKKMIVAEKQLELDALKGKIEKAKSEKSVTGEKAEQLEIAARKLEEMLGEVVDLEEIKDELERSKQLFLQHASSVEMLGAQFESLRKEMEIVKKEAEAATSERQRLEIINSQMKDYGRHNKRIEELKAERDKLAVAAAELENRLSAGRLEDKEQELRALIAKEKEAEMRLLGVEQLANERGARLGEYERALENARKEKVEIERLEALAVDLKIFAEALKQTQAELRKEFVEAVNYTMNTLWQTLYPYQDFVSVRLGIEEGDYVLQLQERALGWVNVEGVASGGERSIACLALRIAFALVLAPNLRILFLDEPSHNLDTASIKVLATTLRENLGELMDQCFIISHDENLEEAVTGNAYRFERDKGKDEATKVVAL